MNKSTYLKSKLIERSKEFVILFIAIFLQSLFNLRSISFYDIEFDYTSPKFILSMLIEIISILVVLYIGFLYLRNRFEKPILELLKYLGIYIGVQILLGFLFGFISVLVENPIKTIEYISASQYMVKYIFLWYVFIKTSKRKLNRLKMEVIFGSILTIIVICINFLITNNMVNIIIDSFYYLLIILYMYFNTFSFKNN